MTKRLFDLTMSLLGIIFLFPLLIAIALLIKADSPGNIIFSQKRIGKNQQPFNLYKFRTMYLSNQKKRNLTIGNDQRITRIGMPLRKHKLDELPQLINIVKGDMSLVGPRPEVPEFVATYSKEEKIKIFSLRPGITDIASIEMIDESSLLGSYDDPYRAYIEKILPIKKKYCIDYVKERTFIGDIKIIFLTIYKIIQR